MNEGDPGDSGLLNLPVELLRRIAAEASSSSTGMRSTSKQCKEYSDAFADTCSVKLIILTAAALNPHPAQDFASLHSFMSQKTRLTKLRVQTHFPLPTPNSDTTSSSSAANSMVQVLGLRDVLTARAPNTTKMSLQQTGHRTNSDPKLYGFFFSPLAANLTSLKLDIHSFFYTAENFKHFSKLLLLEGNGFQNRVRSIDFLIALPSLRKFSICTQSTSPAAFAAMSQIEGVNLKVVEMSTNRMANQGLEGIQKLASVVELHIGYAPFHPPPDLAFTAPPQTAAMLRISQLSSLRCLAITWSGVLDISCLASLVNLERFSLDCRWPTSLSCVSSMPALTHLHLEGTQYDAELPLDLSNNRMLQELVVRNRGVSPQETNTIAALPFLTRLDLCHSWGPSQAWILPLAALTGLVFLRLSYAQVEKTVVRTLLNAMPKLKMLDVRCCKQKNEASFGQLRDLKERIPDRVFITDV